MKSLLKILILLALLVACDKSPSQITTITNCKIDQNIILKKSIDQGSVDGLKIKILGKINGEAKISLILNDEEYSSQMITGKFSFKWRQEWYQDSAKVVYSPKDNSTDGNVNLIYRFLTID